MQAMTQNPIHDNKECGPLVKLDSRKQSSDHGAKIQAHKTNSSGPDGERKQSDML